MGPNTRVRQRVIDVSVNGCPGQDWFEVSGGRDCGASVIFFLSSYATPKGAWAPTQGLLSPDTVDAAERYIGLGERPLVWYFECCTTADVYCQHARARNVWLDCTAKDLAKQKGRLGYLSSFEKLRVQLERWDHPFSADRYRSGWSPAHHSRVRRPSWRRRRRL